MLTGRHPNELPPGVVRGLFWRIYATRAMSLIRVASTPLGPDASTQDKLDHAALMQAARDLEAELFG